MIATIYLVLTSEDREYLSARLQELCPSVVFVDGIRWSSVEPPLIPSIAAATGARVLLWDRHLYPTLPSIQNADGTFTGPSTRYVISLDGSTLTLDYKGREVLVSGGLTWSTTARSSESDAFYRRVFKVARECTPIKVRTVDGGLAKGFRAGRSAAEWWSERPNERLFGLNAAGAAAIPVI